MNHKTDAQSSRQQPNRGGASGRRSLAACCLIVALLWLGVLPAISNRPQIQSEIRDLESRGIDPSAMFYTELDVMDEVLGRIDRFHRRYPSALWIPTARNADDE